MSGTVRVSRVVVATLVLVALNVVGLAAAQARELIYGILAPLTHPVAAQGAAPLFEQLKADTNGSLDWKIVPNGQVLTGEGTLPGLRDRIADGGYLITSYSRSDIPNTNFVGDLFQFGEDAAVVAGATAETMLLHCPQCIEEFRRNKAVWIIGTGFTPSRLLCAKPVVNLADVKGKKIKGTGGVEARWVTAMGGTHLNMTMPDAVVAIERKTIDCIIGPIAFIKAYGMQEMITHVPDAVMGIFRTMAPLAMSRATWDSFTPAEKAAVIKRAPMATMRTTIKGYVDFDEAVRKEGAGKGIKFGGGKDIDELRLKHIEKDRQVLIDDGKKRGVKDPEGLLAAHLQDLEKWRQIVAKTGYDLDKLSQALWDEVYSKVDPDKI
jgi:TRAP-type C4-dicarboxylate transport system substrate-binding protein